MGELRVWLVGLVAAVVTGCGGGGSAPVATPAAASATGRGGTAVIGVMADIENWNPYLTETAFGEDLLALLYPSLMVEQTDYQEHPPSFVPGLATSWEWSPDRLAVTFQLRENAVWSDGAPVTAEDVVFTWRTQQAEALGWSGAWVKEESTAVEAVGAHAVRFRFARDYPYQLMDANEGPIIPAHAWGQIPYADWESTDWQAHALSAGPFRLARWAPQQEIVLEANPTYWTPGRPLLERVVWRVIPNQGSLVTQLAAGELDLLEALPAREAEMVDRGEATRLVVFPDRKYTFVAWNLKRPPLDDVRVRRALTMAIDRGAILATVQHGFGRIAVGPVLSFMWAANRSLAPLPYDPAGARALLAEAGFADSDGDGVLDRGGKRFAIELLTNSESDARRDICVLVHDQLARIGVAVSPRFLEFGTAISRRDAGDFDGLVSSWQEPTKVDLAEVWHSAAPGSESSNFIGYANPEVDRLLDQAAAEASFAAQKPLLDRVQELIVADQPYTFLYENDAVVGLSTRIGGAVITDATPYGNLEEWYLK